MIILDCALGAVVLLVLLQVTRQVGDAEGEEGDLAFKAAVSVEDLPYFSKAPVFLAESKYIACT